MSEIPFTSRKKKNLGKKSGNNSTELDMTAAESEAYTKPTETEKLPIIAKITETVVAEPESNSPPNIQSKFSKKKIKRLNRNKSLKGSERLLFEPKGCYENYSGLNLSRVGLNKKISLKKIK